MTIATIGRRMKKFDMVGGPYLAAAADDGVGSGVA
jgi:hypothetical protein